MEDLPFLNRTEYIDVRRQGNLPHWEQTEKLQFVSFRLADSLPKSVKLDIVARQESFRKLHPEPWDDLTKLRYNSIGIYIEAKLLDEGYGTCVLRNIQARDVINTLIDELDGKVCNVVAYVIMPNHIHLMIQPIGNHSVRAFVAAIKRISSRRINQLLNRKGTLWSKDYYDRIIRDMEHYNSVLMYILQNPRNLPKSDFTLYINRVYSIG